MKGSRSRQMLRLDPRVFRVSEDGCHQTCVMEASTQVLNNLSKASLEFQKKLYDF